MDVSSLSTYLFDEGFPLEYCEAFEGECLSSFIFYFGTYIISIMI